MPETLYRFWRGTELLYVGISAKAYSRISQHRQSGVFFLEADRVTFQHFITRKEVSAAEKLAIRTENPKYNIAMKPKPPKEKPRKKTEWYWEWAQLPWGSYRALYGMLLDGLYHNRTIYGSYDSEAFNIEAERIWGVLVEPPKDELSKEWDREIWESAYHLASFLVDTVTHYRRVQFSWDVAKEVDLTLNVSEFPDRSFLETARHMEETRTRFRGYEDGTNFSFEQVYKLVENLRNGLTIVDSSKIMA